MFLGPLGGSLFCQDQRCEETRSLISGRLPSLASGRPHCQCAVPSEQISELS